MAREFPDDVDVVIRDPLRIVYENFRSSATPGEISEKFEKYFSGENYYRIPSLNYYHASNLPYGSLVRFRCMVQDNTFQPEHYRKVLNLEKTSRTFCNEFAITGLFCDSLQRLEEEGFEFEDWVLKSPQDLGTRHLAFCISPPCESEWMKSKHFNESIFIFPRTTEAGSQDTPLKKYPSHKHEDRISAIVKFYTRGDEVNLNDLIEVSGIMEYNKDSKQVYVHCLIMEYPTNPQLNTPMDLTPMDPNTLHLTNLRPENLRNLIIDNLQKITFSDRLAAEYLLLSLVSSVSTRTSDGIAINNFPINFCSMDGKKIPSHWPTSLYEFVSCLSPYNKYLELSLDVLNTESLSPEMSVDNCEEFGSLKSGALQLLDSTCVIFNELKLAEGKLESLGVENFNTLRNSVRNSVMEYKVPYCNVVKPINLKFIVISNTPSILGLDIIVPITVREFQRETIHNDLVKYIQNLILAPVREYNISPELQDQISSDYVSMRENQKNEKPSSTDLSIMLNVARLISRTLLEPQLSKQAWNLAKKLESERRSRVVAMRKALKKS